MVTEAADLRIDPHRIAVMGDSAGGNLAAALALATRTDRIRPAAQALLYPALRYRFNTASYERFGGFGISRADMEWFWSHYLGGSNSESPLISPLYAPEVSGLPPTFIATASHDVLRDEGEEYRDRLRASGVDVDHRQYDGMIHGFFWMDAVLDRARDLQTDLATWLSDTLR